MTIKKQIDQAISYNFTDELINEIECDFRTQKLPMYLTKFKQFTESVEKPKDLTFLSETEMIEKASSNLTNQVNEFLDKNPETIVVDKNFLYKPFPETDTDPNFYLGIFFSDKNTLKEYIQKKREK